MTDSDSPASTIRFLLDGEVIDVSNVDPTRTVLQFLREDLRRTGSKEGCAEGDCGACTVVLAEINRDGDNIAVHAINSCIQFLPTLDGKELITVESLSGEGQELHPVQQAMFDCHGSQCGFCTPGFVMSLFALYKNRHSPSRRDVDDALAGNLCRCTGYRPIIAAAKAMYDAAPGNDWLRQPHGQDSAPRQRMEKLQGLRRDSMLALSRDGRRFFAPRSAAELAALLQETPDATVLAGGTDVGLWVTKQHRELDTVVYVGNVEELVTLGEKEGSLHIGAAVSLTDAMQLLVEHFPRLEELFLRFASPPIRNAGTLGGNVANGSPIGDSIPALMAANTHLLLRSANGTRELPLDDFYLDYMQNDLRPGEFLEALRVPLSTAGAELYSYKLSKRFDQDIAAVCAAFRLTMLDDKLADVRIAFGGMAATVRRAVNCEAAMRGQSWTEATVKKAQVALEEDFQPISDMRASANYRRRVARNLLRRLFLESRAEQLETVYGYGRTD